ncbi:MAG: hypothetical protein WBN16_04830 [Lutimonas sp.]
MEFFLTDLTVLALVFIPYYIFLKNGNSIKKKVNQLIQKEISSSGLNFTDSEYWAHSFIGIDGVAKKLLFVRVNGDHSDAVTIDLSKIKHIKIDKKIEVDKDNKTNWALNRLDLLVSLSPNGESLIPLFDADVFYKENNENSRAEDWVKKINSCRTFPSTNQKAA